MFSAQLTQSRSKRIQIHVSTFLKNISKVTGNQVCTFLKNNDQATDALVNEVFDFIQRNMFIETIIKTNQIHATYQ